MCVKQRFYEIMDKIVASKKDNNFYLDRDKYAKCLEEVKIAKNVKKKKAVHYRRINRYDILTIGGEEKLIAPIKEENGEIKYYVCYDDLFNILEETHLAIGHGGRTRMLKECSRKYKNITVEAIMTYLKLCQPCQKKQKTLKKGIVIKPILHSEMNSRCQVDLIDLQTNPDGNYKFILVYQDHLTKFVILRALQTKRAAEVAYHLLDIFTTFGAPNILHSDNGREFCNHIIENVYSMWPDVKIVHGKPRHSQSQGSVERANQDIENMLSTWMETNQLQKWSEGLKFIQAMKNRAYHEGIKCSPYEAMFGSPMKVGIASSAIPKDMIGLLRSEEDLENLLHSQENMEQNINDENIIEQDKEDNVVENESEGNINSENARNKTQENEKIVIEKENQITIDANVTIQRFGSETDSEKENATQSEEDAIPKKIKSVQRIRTKAKLNLETQAEKMKAKSSNKYSNIKIGQNVRLKIPDIDRAKTDPKSIIAVVIDVKDNEFYQLGTKIGVLKQLYTQNQFTSCSEDFIKIEEVVKEKEVSLREVVGKLSLTGGQGFKKCNCLKKCLSKKCACKSSGLLCNSKCHNSTPCCNK